MESESPTQPTEVTTWTARVDFRALRLSSNLFLAGCCRGAPGLVVAAGVEAAKTAPRFLPGPEHAAADTKLFTV
ncbi:hypothetical protein D9753_08610 [Streptomyces dangxiongensis]|uniref:Uncharacterized protein n=1 Tax=Streptomyces dangxiongensis TaxID=1442032 RepID=A0A3G2J9I8_9ACTN|nr:hypothetical protein D9753_08610 [Streptomyces dangxiongensis]